MNDVQEATLPQQVGKVEDGNLTVRQFATSPGVDEGAECALLVEREGKSAVAGGRLAVGLVGGFVQQFKRQQYFLPHLGFAVERFRLMAQVYNSV
jgi:hypothetical protein